MTLSISTAHHAVRSGASLAFADTGTGNASLRLYAAGDVLLGVCALAKPCGTLQGDGSLLLLPSDAPEIAVASGVAVRLEWCAGTGAVIADGSVSALGGGGDFELVGTSGTQIYAGAAVLLDGVVIG